MFEILDSFKYKPGDLVYFLDADDKLSKHPVMIINYKISVYQSEFQFLDGNSTKICITLKGYKNYGIKKLNDLFVSVMT